MSVVVYIDLQKAVTIFQEPQSDCWTKVHGFITLITGNQTLFLSSTEVRKASKITTEN